jgi:hypothetical protein
VFVTHPDGGALPVMVIGNVPPAGSTPPEQLTVLRLAVYILSVWHTFGFGDFAFNGPYRLALWIAQIPLAALLLWRLATPFGSASSLRRGRALRAAASVPVAAALVALIAIVATGNIGGGPSPFHRPASAHHTSTRP